MLLKFQCHNENLSHDLSLLGPELRSISVQIIRITKTQKIQ